MAKYAADRNVDEISAIIQNYNRKTAVSTLRYADELATATCVTLEYMAHFTAKGEMINNITDIIKAYYWAANRIAPVIDLAKVTCRTLQYAAEKKISLHKIKERIIQIPEEKKRRIENEYAIKEKELLSQKGFGKWWKIIKNFYEYKTNTNQLIYTSEIYERLIQKE